MQMSAFSFKIFSYKIYGMIISTQRHLSVKFCIPSWENDASFSSIIYTELFDGFKLKALNGTTNAFWRKRSSEKIKFTLYERTSYPKNKVFFFYRFTFETLKPVLLYYYNKYKTRSKWEREEWTVKECRVVRKKDRPKRELQKYVPHNVKASARWKHVN